MLGVALFQTEVDQWQDYSILYNANGQVVSTTLITTDASIRTRGVEVELSARPSEGWDITANLGVVDARYTDYTYGLVNLAGGPVKLVPDWDASLAVGWRPWRGLLLRGELQGVGDMTLHAQNIARQPAYWTGNLQVGWEATSWSARLYADNITDRRGLRHERLHELVVRLRRHLVCGHQRAQDGGYVGGLALVVRLLSRPT